MKQFNIPSAKFACKVISSLLGEAGIMVTPLPGYIHPNGRHYRLVNERSGTIHHVKFAREFFHKLGKSFPEWDGLEGETMDDEVIKQLKNEDTIYFANQERIYSIFVDEFKVKAQTRTTRSGLKSWSIPVKELEVFFEP